MVTVSDFSDPLVELIGVVKSELRLALGCTPSTASLWKARQRLEVN